ncbi:MAG TPA: hypothetical protein VLW17_11250, partial [Thermoanaerobaculaceae bacterium]|nr:hypothetical protein [Thermoanaerobaculaceae bacterium]
DLSDVIAFQAAREVDEAAAAAAFAARLRRTAARLAEDAGIVLAMDGENPWTAYPDGGARFLVALARELERDGRLRLVTLSERLAEETPARLGRLHPGSWIGATFGTWIGDPEKNRGWELLARVRALGGWRGGESWLAAEGSDWWWWLGDDNPTLLAPLYDELFRAHLRDACSIAGVVPPAELSAPVRSAALRLRVPLSTDWPTPGLRGAPSSYFDWTVAAWVEAPPGHRRFARVALRAEPGRLWLRVEPPPGAAPPSPLVVTIAAGERRTTISLPDDLPGDSALGRCLEAAFPLPAGDVRLALESGGERMPVEGFWRLDLVEVDGA